MSLADYSCAVAPPTHRGRVRLGAFAAGLAVLLAACGGEEAAKKDTADAAAAVAGFPVTIDHRYGSATIPKPPERVVSVGYHEQDTILALGVQPVAVRDWLATPFYPWSEDVLGDAKPKVLAGDTLNFEEIAALKPDLIIATSALLEEADYATLSKIAPTVVEPSNYVGFGMPWQEITRTIGRALGRLPQADALVADVEARFAQASEDHPEFRGRTGVVAYDFGEGGLGAYGPQDPRARFLTSLGFEAPPQIAELAGDQFFAEISGEQLHLLDADVLVWILYLEPGKKGRIEGDPLYPGLEVAKQGRDVFLPQDDNVQAALSFSTVLSLPYALDELVPRLAAAVDGDPATKPRA